MFLTNALSCQRQPRGGRTVLTTAVFSIMELRYTDIWIYLYSTIWLKWGCTVQAACSYFETANNNYNCTWQGWLHANFIPQVTSNKGDFNGAMNFINYNKWLIEKVILNPYPHSAVVARPPPSTSAPVPGVRWHGRQEGNFICRRN